MSEGMTCYERDEVFCAEQRCLQAGKCQIVSDNEEWTRQMRETHAQGATTKPIRSLINEIHGVWDAFEIGLRQEISNTNYAVVKQKLAEAELALQALSAPLAERWSASKNSELADQIAATQPNLCENRVELIVDMDERDQIVAALRRRSPAASGDQWSAIDKELSAYVGVVRSDLIEACAKEAERCDTHAMFCMADPRAVRQDIASRIRALNERPSQPATSPAESETRFITDSDRAYADGLLEDLRGEGLTREDAAQWFCKARVENARRRSPTESEREQVWRDSDWIGLSASEKAAYDWPDDTELHRCCRAAYVAGATDYARQSDCPSQPGNGWMPIETAPRDGTRVIVCTKNRFPKNSYVARWLKDGWKVGPMNDWDAYPDHWMPLPALTSTDGERA